MLTVAIQELEALGEDIRRNPLVAIDQLRKAAAGISNAQLYPFGVYELFASRYELLCGQQGARTVADPTLLGTFLGAPAAYSSAGRQAYHQQQRQAIRTAAHTAGRRQGGGSSGGSCTDGNPRGGGRGRTRTRRGVPIRGRGGSGSEK